MVTVRKAAKALRLAAHRETYSEYRRAALRGAAAARSLREMRKRIEDSLIQGVVWPALPAEIDAAIRGA